MALLLSLPFHLTSHHRSFFRSRVGLRRKLPYLIFSDCEVILELRACLFTLLKKHASARSSSLQSRSPVSSVLQTPARYDLRDLATSAIPSRVLGKPTHTQVHDITTMYACYRISLLFLKAFTRTSSISLLRVLPKPSPSPLAHSYRTTESASEKQCLRTNYLINSCGFSPENASQLSRVVTFVKSDAPDAILELLKSLNLSDSMIRDIIKRAPQILSCDHARTITPKIEFFKSKGASSSQLAQMVTHNPWLLHHSLENQIIPNYDLMRSLLHSDEKTVTSIQRSSTIVTDYYLAQKVKLLHDYGMSESRIAQVIAYWPILLSRSVDKLKMVADELTEMGFHPSKSTFMEALRTKVVISKSLWERKVELYRRWGWSDETILEAYMKGPVCMVASCGKIDAVMDFLVTRMGWDSFYLAKNPRVLNFSLEKRLVPRAFVLQFLQSRGLIKKVTTSSPFVISEEMFLQKFVNCFKDEAPQLLKLYEEKLNLLR
ncbi:transcription termination factor family protein [Senna tora]|uniref:Transcription termination factor family protein n=1 Tax=Senna tora TaxID=362788 RepID=A0A834T282_9FABA|nr:transcription termination factor family protein [Senna tora]